MKSLLWGANTPFGSRAVTSATRYGDAMEAFEQFVAVALEWEGFVVSEAVKFPITRRTRKSSYAERQTHGYEIDLVGARADGLVLATVKSFLGSRGVVADQVRGDEGAGRGTRLYAILNDSSLREAVIAAAANRFGYTASQVQLRLYVGKFASPTQGTHEAAVRDWCASQHAGGGPIKVFALREIVGAVRDAARSKTYRDNPVLVTMKVLSASGLLTEDNLIDDIPSSIVNAAGDAPPAIKVG